MTVMLYPNKKDPMGYRVQDKIFKVNDYFPFSQHGDKAFEKAETRQSQLDQNRKFRNMRLDLGINKIFKDSGEVIGLKRTTKVKITASIKIILFHLKSSTTLNLLYFTTNTIRQIAINANCCTVRYG